MSRSIIHDKLTGFLYALALILFIYPRIILTNSFEQSLLKAQSLLTQKKLDLALVELQGALKIKPNTAETDLILGNKLLELGNEYFAQLNVIKSIEAFKTILAISDSYSAVYHNIAFTLAERLGNYQESLPYFKRALELNPDNAETHFCAALSYLATGDLVTGFEHYLWRWKRNGHEPRTFSSPITQSWQGENLRNKTILIRAEQGLGDTVQFIRYGKLLQNLGATVIAEVQKPLVSLLSYCSSINHVIAIGDILPTFDYQVNFLDLPALFKTTLETIPNDNPYLVADPALIAYWRVKLSSDKKFKIGICWYGDITHGNRKFMPLELFAQLATLDNISLYSLQRVTGLDQLETLTHLYSKQNIHCPVKTLDTLCNDNFDKSHGRFMDTAAVICNLDLVISVDTCTAHVAAGLGAPTWIILPFPAEWRWLTPETNPCVTRSSSGEIISEGNPWYPQVEIFRQQEVNNWKPVINALLTRVQQLNT